MQEYKIEIKESVHKFLNNLGKYIFEQSKSFSISKTIVENIYFKIFSLKTFPYIYPHFDKQYRVLTIDSKYRVFYTIHENQKVIIIHRIFSSSQNYSQKIKQTV